MWSSIFLHIIISVIIVMIIHYIWDYCKNTYNQKSPKKNIANTQIQKYKEIIEKLQAQKMEKFNENTNMEEDLEKFMEETMNS